MKTKVIPVGNRVLIKKKKADEFFPGTKIPHARPGDVVGIHQTDVPGIRNLSRKLSTASVITPRSSAIKGILPLNSLLNNFKSS